MTTGLGKKISEYRSRSGLGSQKVAAPTLDVTKNTLWSYENEKTLPDIDFLARFARATGADLSELIRLRLEAAGFEQQATALKDAPGEYTVGGSVGGNIDAAAHARRSLLHSGNLDPAWSLAIMELAARGDISPTGVDRLIELIRDRQPDEN